MKITVKIINGFTINNKGGNPAGIVLDADELKSEEKQSIAAKVGISETAFVSASNVADFKLDFFTPVKQIAHCGHATIATFSYLKQIQKIKQNNSSKETIDGIRNIYFEGNDAFMEQNAPSYKVPKVVMAEILASLNLKNSDLINDLEATIVNTGNSFFIIPVSSEAILKKIEPNFNKIEKVSEQFNLIGYYVFTNNVASKDFDATTRMFAPLYGIEEEAATGMAAGPLGCYLYHNGLSKTSFNIEQGKFMKEPSVSKIKVNLNIEDDKITNLFAGGSASISNEIIVEL
ncbi:MAG: PhzF family phenazine biosynthesis isomerase [Panacibacter sp.]